MTTDSDQVKRVLERLDRAWTVFQESYAGLSDAEMLQPGVTDDWTVKDILAHVTTWEEEALKYLPLIVEGGRPPRYVTYGGIDAFNARKTEQKRVMSLAQVRRDMEETHRHLVDLIHNLPSDQLRGETRSRRRLRLDTYSHYPEHTKVLREWRVRRESESANE
jgi:hypothetical protein